MVFTNPPKPSEIWLQRGKGDNINLVRVVCLCLWTHEEQGGGGGGGRGGGGGGGGKEGMIETASYKEHGWLQLPSG